MLGFVVKRPDQVGLPMRNDHRNHPDTKRIINDERKQSLLFPLKPSQSAIVLTVQKYYE
jgi:hypothetical protein